MVLESHWPLFAGSNDWFWCGDGADSAVDGVFRFEPDTVEDVSPGEATFALYFCRSWPSRVDRSLPVQSNGLRVRCLRMGNPWRT